MSGETRLTDKQLDTVEKLAAKGGPDFDVVRLLVAEVREHRALVAGADTTVEWDAQRLSRALDFQGLPFTADYLSELRACLSRMRLLASRASALEQRAAVDALKHQELDKARAQAETERDAAEAALALEKQQAATFRAAVDAHATRMEAKLEGIEQKTALLGNLQKEASTLKSEEDIITCPFCVGEGRVDFAPRSQWKADRDGLACPWRGHVCTVGVHLPEEPMRWPDVRSLVKQARMSITPDVAPKMGAALGIPTAAFTPKQPSSLEDVVQAFGVAANEAVRPVSEFLEECSGTPLDESDLLEEASRVEGEVGTWARMTKAARTRLYAALKAVGWEPG